MTAPRIIPAAEARALLEAATPGPWDVGRPAYSPDKCNIYARQDGIGITSACESGLRLSDAELAAAAPDLAATVVALHAEVERAAAAERARIVAMLTEMWEATCGDDGRDTVVSLAYRSAVIGVFELTP